MISRTFNRFLRSIFLLTALTLSVPAQQFGQNAARNTTGGARTGTTAGGAGAYPSNTQIGEAIISSDPETRRLIVITDEETSQYVQEVITNLDQPKPQVLINVVFLEATYTGNFDFGVESSYGRQLGNTTLGATNLFGGLAAQGGANNFGTPGAGLYSLAGRDFSVTLRAIAANGKLEVLSRPTILARNNQLAYILVGQQVPLVTSVTYSPVNGLPINSVTYRDVGIILRVTPFITADGNIEMIVAPEISSLDSSRTIAISQGVVAPVINTRSADTVVVTQDGQTVVIGGLMENTKTQSESKVPFLGDIPGLGNLFKRKQKGSTKTELIIFLTPHVVKDPSQLRGVSEIEGGRAVLAPKAFPEEELNRFLDNVPMRGTVPASKPESKD